MTSEPPWALFVLDENIDTEYLNRSLQLAHEWDNASWDLWVATDSYEDMPKVPGERGPLPEATKPPLEDSFKSPWIGKTVEDCAKWLQNAPNNSAVLRDYFTAMDRYSKQDDTVLTCRVWVENDEVKVDYYPLPTAHIQMYMWTNRCTRFDEAGYHYQSRVKRDGKPDRSQGGPFE
ncbi:hypothetical protein P153DRAFT_431952 [Dothidotthia symphoricarpi CBS 119687]|uniref:Uncharacterized protein n=1 Tax=Dothidotthia symphoricarpi CBS 119687 TaxID=1392245 RepID=A0A6A6A8S8_9PLEO|nr:uncharacterized protein P153DRAFT_431952 [Dothidotthia symphoricarpi CBS 119687]KAF2128259.1 hypothetical protein P153DRAFT_431952 [Dothidotthia symphoricarpi CBS 119687]